MDPAWQEDALQMLQCSPVVVEGCVELETTFFLPCVPARQQTLIRMPPTLLV